MSENEFIEYTKLLGIELTNKQLEQFNLYYEMLIEKNKVMNLTGITEKKDVYLKHFYDSLCICKAVNLNEYSSLCDVGTGAGFPGMVLKIAYPNLNVTLVDSLNKRVNFLNEVIEKLGLIKINVIHSRIEEHKGTYDIVTARAVSKLNILLEYCIPLVKVNGYFIPLKANITSELNESANALKELKSTVEENINFLLPFENSSRTILKIKKNANNPKYPRKYSEIKKHPL